MNTIKICTRTPKYEEVALVVTGIYETADSLRLTIPKRTNATVGDIVKFNRAVRANDTEKYYVTKEVKIAEVIYDKATDTTIVKTEALQKKTFVVTDASVSEDGEYVKVDFGENLDLFPQDLYCAQDTNAAILTVSNGVYTDTWVCNGDDVLISVNGGIDAEGGERLSPKDFLVKKTRFDIYNECDGRSSGLTKDVENNYLSERYYSNSIWLKKKDFPFEKYKNATLTVSQNGIYFKSSNNATDSAVLWDSYNKGRLAEFYKANGFSYDDSQNNKVTVTVSKAYWSVPIGITADNDEVHLNQEETLNDIFTNDIKSKIIPDFIDMERVKYAPAICNGTSFQEVGEISFNFHFRTRTGNDWAYTKNGYWNGIQGLNYITDVKALKSDLLSDLNFTDTDIWYQKMKLKQSFIRLSFYTSDDPLDQSLLYYSTIFLDSGSLYGKFMKVRAELKGKNETWDAEAQPTYVIDKSTNSSVNRLDTHISVNDEYNTEKSSEGFNLYLFLDDAVSEIDIPQKTIYMRVDFNHAGYGRTIPMVWLPAETGAVSHLTIANYREALYIPIKIAYFNGKRYYCVDKTKREKSSDFCYKESLDDSSITFNLFEPRLKGKNE